MSAFIELLQPYFRFWPYAIAALVGIPLALIDRRVFGRHVLGALLVAVAIGGQVVMQVSPFTFGGGDHYMQGLIASCFALAGLVGYVAAVAGCWMFGGKAA